MGNASSTTSSSRGVKRSSPELEEPQPYMASAQVASSTPPILEVVVEPDLEQDTNGHNGAVPVTPDSHVSLVAPTPNDNENHLQSHTSSRRRFFRVARLVQHHSSHHNNQDSNNNNTHNNAHMRSNAQRPGAQRQPSVLLRGLPQPGHHRIKSTQRNHAEYLQCKRIAQKLVNEYKAEWYQDTLGRLKESYQTSEFADADNVSGWAHHMYATLRDAGRVHRSLLQHSQSNASDSNHGQSQQLQLLQQQQQQAEAYRKLNLDRRTVMQLLHDLLKEWKDHSASGHLEEFELALDQVFTRHNLLDLLKICLPLERARALVFVQHGRWYGVPWFSACHLTHADATQDWPAHEVSWHDHPFVQEHAAEQRHFEAAYTAYLGQLQQQHNASPVSGSGNTPPLPPLEPPMPSSLFFLLYSDILNLQTDRSVKEWSLPCMPNAHTSGFGMAREVSSMSSSAASSSEENERQMRQVVQSFVAKYHGSHYQDALHRLDVDYLRSASPSAQEWAKDVYTTLRQDKSDGRAAALNNARLDGLRLLYDLAEEWEDRKYSAQFEAVLSQVFRPSRIARILRLCLPLDRAHALYKTRRPWVSEGHLDDTTVFATDHPQEFQQCRDLMAAYLAAAATSHHKGGRSHHHKSNVVVPTTMKKDLFRILFSKKFGLQEDAGFQKWSMPAMPGGHSRPGLVSEDSLASRYNNARHGGKTGAHRHHKDDSRLSKGTIDSNATSEPDLLFESEQDKDEVAHFKKNVKVFVRKYDEPDYREALEHLEADFAHSGSASIEEWAKNVYIKFREDPDNVRAKGINTDRRQCLELVYEMVREWEEHDYSSAYEQAMEDTFKVRRLVRILSYCLPLDRAQALYKMQHEGRTGLPWYCKLHLEPNTPFARDYPNEQRQLMERVASYTGFPPMNKKLFRLLFSDRLGLQSKNADFRQWSMPYTPRKDNSSSGDAASHRF